MKKIFTLLIGIVFAITILNAQDEPPQAFSFKATIQGANGQTVVNKMIRLRISVLQDDMNGFTAYSEYFTPNTNHYSQVDVEIGRGNVLSGIFSSIDWSAHTYFLKVEVDAKGGTNYQLLSITQLLSVPYALYAGSAGNAFSGNYSDLIGAPILAIVASTGNYNDLINPPTLFSGNYNDLINLPPLFSGNYEDLFNKPTLFDGTWSSLTGKPSFSTVAISGSWNDLINKPITLDGYGITDALNSSHPASGITLTNFANWNTAFGWGDHAGLYRPFGYVPAWTEITSKPTTLTGYGITDAMSTSHAANSITATNITNWNTAFNWGNHSGLYRPITYVPAWSEIIDKPTIDGSETKVTSGTNVTVTGEGTTTNPYSINSSGVGTTIPGNDVGDMQYWNGNSWVIVPVGSEGQVLTLINGIPTWGSSVSSLLFIGDSYLGGKVACFLQPGDPGYDARVQHGLIAAPFDQGYTQWGCSGTEILGADGWSIGTGAQNTIDIETNCTIADIAAKLCSELELNGYSDWYLPSKDELFRLCSNKTAIGGFASAYYWSSTEANSTNAWNMDFGSGRQGSPSKNNLCYMRAVRSF